MKWTLLTIGLFVSSLLWANDTSRLYNPLADAEKDMTLILARAKETQKHVLVIVGGNWCAWCYRFDHFVKRDQELQQIVNNNYLVYHLNYSRENQNLDYLAKLGNPQRFGFPVLVFLNADGKLLHTQDSGLLQQGNLYSYTKIKNLFINWAPSILATTH